MVWLALQIIFKSNIHDPVGYTSDKKKNKIATSLIAYMQCLSIDYIQLTFLAHRNGVVDVIERDIHDW